MAKPPYVELGQGPDAVRIPILYEDRAVIAIDKPRHWMLVPFTWQKTDRNLQAAIQSSIGAGAFWARSRHVRFLRYVHRLDADTTGILLFAKSPGGTQSLGDLFESRRMHKRYLAIVQGVPRQAEWTCTYKLEKDPAKIGRMKVDPQHGKEAETRFRVLETRGTLTLVEAFPLTGRTHQIRVHLATDDLPVLGDDLYGGAARVPLALRAVALEYQDPFTRRAVRIRAPVDDFLREYGFGPGGTPASPAPATNAAAEEVPTPAPTPTRMGEPTATAPSPRAQSKGPPPSPPRHPAAVRGPDSPPSSRRFPASPERRGRPGNGPGRTRFQPAEGGKRQGPGSRGASGRR